MKNIQAFVLGMYEFRRDLTTHFDADALIETYDKGRDLAHRLTLRKYDISL